MIGITVKTIPKSRYGDEWTQDYYYNGPLPEAIEIIDAYQRRQGDDWYKIDIEISNVRMLPEHYEQFASRITGWIRNLAELKRD